MKEESERSLKSVVDKTYLQDNSTQFQKLQLSTATKDASLASRDGSKLKKNPLLDPLKNGQGGKIQPEEKRKKALQTLIEKGLLVSNRGFETQMTNLVNLNADRKR